MFGPPAGGTWGPAADRRADACGCTSKTRAKSSVRQKQEQTQACGSAYSPMCGAPGGGDHDQAKKSADLASFHSEAHLWRVSSPLDAAASATHFIPLHGHAPLASHLGQFT